MEAKSGKYWNFWGPKLEHFQIKNQYNRGSKSEWKIKSIIERIWNGFVMVFARGRMMKNEVFVWEGIVFREICVLKLKTPKGGLRRSIWEAFGGRSWASGGEKWRFKKAWEKASIFDEFWGSNLEAPGRLGPMGLDGARWS